jgi:hypothetical protein
VIDYTALNQRYQLRWVSQELNPSYALAITLRGSQKRLRVGYDPIASGLPPIAVRGRPFLSEHADHIRSRYYKGGLSAAIPIV